MAGYPAKWVSGAIPPNNEYVSLWLVYKAGECKLDDIKIKPRIGLLVR